MGSPLSAILSEVFVYHIKGKFGPQIRYNGKQYFRHFDDFHYTIDNDDDINPLHNYPNNKQVTNVYNRRGKYMKKSTT